MGYNKDFCTKKMMTIYQSKLLDFSLETDKLKNEIAWNPFLFILIYVCKHQLLESFFIIKFLLLP